MTHDQGHEATGLWINLTPTGARALVGIGLMLPAEPGQALLGLPREAGRVDGARPLVLPHDPMHVWWAGEARLLGREVERRQIRVRRRWAYPWTPGTPWEIGPDPLVMGVVNVTPDSFSDGGRYLDPARAHRAIRRHWREGAAWADVGGESTRPGHTPVPWEEEWDRVRPVLEAFSPDDRRRLSVDTRKPEVAARAVRLGVGIINDVSGGSDAMIEVLAEAPSTGYVLMFNREPPWPAGALDWAALLRFLAERLDLMQQRGVSAGRIMIDPGLGFGYGVEDNLTVLAHLEVLRVLNRPVLVGASRKRFIGWVTGRPPAARDAGSQAAATVACLYGADVVRAHRVAPTLDAVRLAAAVVRHA